MARLLLVATFIALQLAAGTAPADEPATKPLERVWADATPSWERIQSILDEPLASDGLRFDGLPLIEVVEFLSQHYDVQVDLDRPGLNDAGIGADLLVTAEYHNVSLRTALTRLLQTHDLAFYIEDDVLLITSLETECFHDRTAIYPVADLMQVATSDEVVAAIMSAQPDAFERNGGTSTITAFGGQYAIVTSNDDVHRRIGQMLKALRKVVQTSPPQELPNRLETPSDQMERESGGGQF